MDWRLSLAYLSPGLYIILHQIKDPPKREMLVTLGDRSFSAAAPYLWNSLPAELRDIQSLAVFKCQLKTYLCRAAFTR